MRKQQSITSLPVSPEQDRHRRMVRYSIMMGIRLLCLVGLLFVHEWWLMVLLAAGAILLPYVAVVVANVSMRRAGQVERPGHLVATGAEREHPRQDDGGRLR